MRTARRSLRACFTFRRGPVFGQKAGWPGATREALRAATTEQLRKHSRAGRSQTAFCPKTGPLRILKQALRENLRLSSLILAYSRLSSLIGRKMFEASRLF